VLAACDGKGKLNDLLSVDVSAEAYGNFELVGLTPGTYRVQAAMDGIWLSREVRLTVEPERVEREPLLLDIGEPGTASVVEVVRPDGKPIPGKSAKIIRPDGPLTDRLWPAEFISDGAGVVHIPPLEFGSHKVRIAGTAVDYRLVIPQLLKVQTEPAKLRIVVE
jgi:hypothetical protein